MKGFYTRLKVNNKERTKFFQHVGVRRHAYNWGLELCIDLIRKNKKIPTSIDLHKLLVKNVKPNNKWYYKVSKCPPQQALRNLIDAFSIFWKQHKMNKNLSMDKRYMEKYMKQYYRGEIKKLTVEHEKGFPKFKKKGQDDSFYLERQIHLGKNKIKVPVMGWLRTYEDLPKKIKLKNVTINRVADDWFISFMVTTYYLIPT